MIIRICICFDPFSLSDMDCGVCHQNFEVLKWKIKLEKVLTDDMGNIVLFSCGRTFHYFCLIEIFAKSDGNSIKCPHCTEDHQWNTMVTVHKHKDRGVYSKQSVVLETYEEDILELKYFINKFKTTYFGKLSYGEYGWWMQTNTLLISNCINCSSDEHYFEDCQHGFYMSDSIPCQSIMAGFAVMMVRYIPTGPNKSAGKILATVLSDFKIWTTHLLIKNYTPWGKLLARMIKSFLSILYYKDDFLICRRCGSRFHEVFKCSEDTLGWFQSAILGEFQYFCYRRYGCKKTTNEDVFEYVGY